MNELNSDELILLTELLHQHRGDLLHAITNINEKPDECVPPPDLMIKSLVKVLELNKSISKKLLGE